MQITILALSSAVLPVAEAVRSALEAEELGVSVLGGAEVTPSLFAQGGFYVLTSTADDRTDQSEDFARALERERPDLSGGNQPPIEYATLVIGQQGSTAPRLDPLLASLGARRIGHAALDPSEGPERAIRAVDEWVALLLRRHEGDEDPSLFP